MQNLVDLSKALAAIQQQMVQSFQASTARLSQQAWQPNKTDAVQTDNGWVVVPIDLTVPASPAARRPTAVSSGSMGVSRRPTKRGASSPIKVNTDSDAAEQLNRIGEIFDDQQEVLDLLLSQAAWQDPTIDRPTDNSSSPVPDSARQHHGIPSTALVGFIDDLAVPFRTIMKSVR